MAEQADVVIAGARCAGAVAAATLARQGLRVIAVDPARYPSTTVSTHLLFAGGVAELARAGVLDRVEKIGAPRLSACAYGPATAARRRIRRAGRTAPAPPASPTRPVAPAVRRARSTRPYGRWERRRDAECVHTYHWTNLLGCGDALAPVQFELLRVLTGGPGGVRRVLDVYSRLRAPRETLALPGLLRATVRALAHGAGERPAILRSATEALRELAGNRREARRLILP